MNKTNFIHAVIAVGLQLIVVLFTGNWLAGAMLGTGFYGGREHNQYETRKKNKEPSWNKDAILDFVCPLGATMGLAIVAINLGWKF